MVNRFGCALIAIINMHKNWGDFVSVTQMERERASWEQEVTAAHDNELLSEEQRRERKTAIDEINRETKDGRERTQTLKERRQAQVGSGRGSWLSA